MICACKWLSMSLRRHSKDKQLALDVVKMQLSGRSKISNWLVAGTGRHGRAPLSAHLPRQVNREAIKWPAELSCIRLNLLPKPSLKRRPRVHLLGRQQRTMTTQSAGQHAASKAMNHAMCTTHLYILLPSTATLRVFINEITNWKLQP